MFSVIAQLFLLSVGICLSYGDLYNLPARTELLMYRHRNKIIYNRLKAEGCSAPPALNERTLAVSARIELQLEMEKAFYEELIDLLLTCRGSNTISTTSTTQLSTTTTVYTTTTPRITTCGHNYILNPVSNTCLRVVAKDMNWDDAKVNCESAGENLAVFETLDSVQWVISLLRNSTTPQEWKTKFLWIGLRSTGGIFRWQGRVNDVISTYSELWADNEPHNTGDNECGCVVYITRYQGLNDCICEQTQLYHICEKIL